MRARTAFFMGYLAAIVIASVAVCVAMFPGLSPWMVIGFAIGLLSLRRFLNSKRVNDAFRAHRARERNAGRWLEAPVAELDKSTVGKLLTSRAHRDPSLHVVASRSPVPACSDLLYDSELDGSSGEF